jgi:hypothetical protein
MPNGQKVPLSETGGASTTPQYFLMNEVCSGSDMSVTLISFKADSNAAICSFSSSFKAGFFPS